MFNFSFLLYMLECKKEEKITKFFKYYLLFDKKLKKIKSLSKIAYNKKEKNNEARDII